MADVPEDFSDIAQEKAEANDVQIITSQKRKIRKKQILSVVSSESSSTDTVNQLISAVNKV